MSTELLPIPPDPEYHDGRWFYKGQRYYKTEAFREWNDDRVRAIEARIRALDALWLEEEGEPGAYGPLGELRAQLRAEGILP